VGDSGAAIVWRDRIQIIRSIQTSHPISSWFSVIERPRTFTAAHWNCDGRLVVVSAALGDPLIGGQVQILSGLDNTPSQTPALPVPLDLTFGFIESGWLVVLGRGETSMTTPLPELSQTCETPNGF
jgi:hypothetical protein